MPSPKSVDGMSRFKRYSSNLTLALICRPVR